MLEPDPDSLNPDPLVLSLIAVTELLKSGGKNCLSVYLVVVLKGLVIILLHVETPASQYIKNRLSKIKEIKHKLRSKDGCGNAS